MKVERKEEIITISLTEDECITAEYMESFSSLFLQTQIEKLFENRKNQHIDDLRNKITKDMTRDELLKTVEGK